MEYGGGGGGAGAAGGANNVNYNNPGYNQNMMMGPGGARGGSVMMGPDAADGKSGYAVPGNAYMYMGGGGAGGAGTGGAGNNYSPHAAGGYSNDNGGAGNYGGSGGAGNTPGNNAAENQAGTQNNRPASSYGGGPLGGPGGSVIFITLSFQAYIIAFRFVPWITLEEAVQKAEQQEPVVVKLMEELQIVVVLETLVLVAVLLEIMLQAELQGPLIIVQLLLMVVDLLAALVVR